MNTGSSLEKGTTVLINSQGYVKSVHNRLDGYVFFGSCDENSKINDVIIYL